MAQIVFKINGKEYKVDGRYGPNVSLNEYIRNVADLRGTKAMCHEGGCGVCVVTVIAATGPDDEVKTFAVNSVLLPEISPCVEARGLQPEQRTSLPSSQPPPSASWQPDLSSARSARVVNTKLGHIVAGSLPAQNECLVSVLSCHGWEVTTVEGIGNRTKGYHQLQRRLASFNGTQCGYCTPGWISNMYSLHQSKKDKLTTQDIENSFAGNLCRCTGYRSIADAFKTFANDTDETLTKKLLDLEDLGMFKPCGTKCKNNCSHCKENIEITKKDNEESDNSNETVDGLGDDWYEFKNKDMIVVDCGEHKWYKAYKLEHVFDAMKNGDYKMVAGNTGQGVYHITDYPKNVIDILDVAELKGYYIDVNIVLGAGMPLQEMMEVFLKLSREKQEFSYLKQLYEHMDLVAHIPVRNIGTIAGNLCLKNAHKEFPSDLFLILETVGAMVTLAETVNKTSIVTLEDFLNTDLTGKVVMNVVLPPLSQCCFVKTFKIMPRAQNAHAIVNAGILFHFHENSNLLKKATIVYGGISSTFIHASKTEEALKEKDPYSEEVLELALHSLDGEVVAKEAPPEPSSGFRKMLAIALYYKAILSLCPIDKMNPKYRSGGEIIKRSTSQGTQTFETDKSIWPLNQPVPKIEALVQSSGESTFANDYPTQVNELFAVFVTADVNPGSVVAGFDAAEALKLSGVAAFYTAKDIPGKNTFTPTKFDFADEEILADKEIKFYGQPVGIIAANEFNTAVKAAKLVKINYSSINKADPLLTIDEVLQSPEKDKRVVKDKTIEPESTGDDVKETIKGEFKMEGQYHFTMEPQTCVVKPTEDGMEVYSSTQWLDLTNVAVAESLNIPVNSINVIVRRVGGGYGSKISRATQVACAAALVSRLQGKVCRFVLSLRDNMKIVGKRLPTNCKFDIGVNTEGVIQYLKNTFYQDVGSSFNESLGSFTTTHFPNSYDSKRWFIEAHSVVTDTASNTWCRAPASTEAVAMIENMMEKIAYKLKKDPTEIRLANMIKENNPVIEMIDQLKMDCKYNDRNKEIEQFNENNRWRKRALKLLPLTYDLFYFGNFNCLISIYHADGTVVITHGGIEMGQGINTKAAQVCAYKLGIPLNKISVKPSTSFTSPNAIVTGGSIGSECVVFATVKACDIILDRLKPIKEKLANASWEQIVADAHNSGIDLQASYMWSLAKNELKPYNIYAVIALEVEVDILTGNHEVRRVDLLEDTGRSLNPEIDVAQIEGALVMGLGYWTSEKLVYDKNTGKLLTDRTWTYKPPGLKDIPADMRIYFRRNAKNEFGVLQSKATGEPALCLATVVIHALRAAVQAARLDASYPEEWIDIENPCTVESIFMAVGHKLEHLKLK